MISRTICNFQPLISFPDFITKLRHETPELRDRTPYLYFEPKSIFLAIEAIDIEGQGS